MYILQFLAMLVSFWQIATASVGVIVLCVVCSMPCVVNSRFILDWVHGFKLRPCTFSVLTVLPCRSMTTLNGLRHMPHPLLISTRHRVCFLRTSPMRQRLVSQVNLSLNCRRMHADFNQWLNPHKFKIRVIQGKPKPLVSLDRAPSMAIHRSLFPYCADLVVPSTLAYPPTNPLTPVNVHNSEMDMA